MNTVGEKRVLTAEDLPLVLALQEVACKELAAIGKPRFIIPRSEKHFLAHMESPHAMVGLFDEGRHFAQAIFRAPLDFDTEELGIDALPGHEKGTRASVLQGILVHPDYAGRGIMRQILAEWEAWCREQNIMHMSARSEHTHEASKKNFLKSGFTLVETVTDKRDGATVCVFYKHLSPASPLPCGERVG